MPEEELKSNRRRATVGAQLKRRRQQLKLSLAQVEVATKIRGKYLTQLESDDYADLPNDIYTKGFVTNYANFLGLDGEELARDYVAERGGEQELARVSGLKVLRDRRIILTPAVLIAIMALMIVVSIITYLAWQLTSLAGAPKLEVKNPAKDEVVYGSLIDIGGHADGGADVTVNNSPVLTDANGDFADKIALQDGANTISVVAVNKLGKTTTVVRNVLAHVPSLKPGENDVPAASFDGVAVQVQIHGSATGVKVVIDGKDDGFVTMLDGVTQLFKAKDNITITTKNGAATFLMITNSKVAGKKVGPVGGDGQLVKDLDFGKDVNFQ